jgi:uncharacterized surface protein with fasciclin (FAS1) repeats
MIDLIGEEPGLSILNAALQKTNLDDTLLLNRAYTLFAPSDTAFRALPAPFNSTASITALADNDPNVQTLYSVLRFHVLAGQFAVESFQTGSNVNRTLPLRGGTDSLFFSKSISRVFSVNGARVIDGNIAATTNGNFIHIINKVLLPPTGDLLQTLAATPNLRIATAALNRTGIANGLRAPGVFTVFAPTDSAFTAILRSLNPAVTDETTALSFVNNTLSGSSTPNTAALSDILLYHAAAGRYYSRAVAADSLRNLPTLLAGRTLALTAPARDVLSVTGAGNGGQAASLRTADIPATNGVIHAVNRVLLP